MVRPSMRTALCSCSGRGGGNAKLAEMDQFIQEHDIVPSRFIPLPGLELISPGPGKVGRRVCRHPGGWRDSSPLASTCGDHSGSQTQAPPSASCATRPCEMATGPSQLNLEIMD